MVTADPALRSQLAEILAAGGIPDAELEAKWILEDVPDAQTAVQIAKRRAAHEPLQYLLGTWEFYGLRLYVGKGVLIPRADTETLVDAVLERYRGRKNLRIADLCSGSGCIALALRQHLPNAEITGIENSGTAREYALRNAAYTGLPVPFVQGDVLCPETAAQYRDLDVIVSNPPYLTADDMAHLQAEVRHEPALALAGGKDGLRFYEGITPLWRDALKKGGMLVYEVGIGQADAVSAILSENGFTYTEKIRDLNGVERVVMGVRS